MKSLDQGTIVEVFGDFRPYLTEEGKPSVFWEDKILTMIDFPQPMPLAWDRLHTVSRMRCHKKIAPFLEAALIDLHSIPEVWVTINDFGGAYEFRLQRKSTNSLSNHAWAIAIDLDVGDNPFGKEPKVHPTTVEVFKSHGFLWGGEFQGRRKDGMHFEFADLSKLT